MVPNTNPFANLDVSKILGEFKLPGVDMETIVATQRKNIDALTKANQLALEGFQTVARRQVEIIRAGIEEASTHMRDMMSAKTNEERVAKQTALAKQSVEKAIANARELAEIVAKAQNEAFDVLNKRFTEGLDEVGGLVKKK
ncbi:MAG TPA: phasin family protein [Stellaceae bacterium]|jgi:phasin family protein|nr:phasin family protein [Stellaceae bacterium]